MTAAVLAFEDASSSASQSIQTLSVLEAPANSDSHGFGTPDTAFTDGQALMNNRKPSTSEADAGYGSDQISVYVVRPGDTLSQIATMFDVTENTIRWANNIPAKSSIQPDQELIILPISGIKYTVKKGDTLKSIASSFNSDTNEILSYNSLHSAADLKVGAEIIIPNGEITTTTSVKKPAGSTSGGSTSSSGTKSTGLTRPVKGGTKTQGIHGHNGIDIAAPLNTSILAAASGKVIIAKQGGWNGGYGNYVVISHPNGTQTLYAHLNTVGVSVGQNVSQGAVLGGMGSTGDSTGIHLHFEVRGGTNPF